MRACDFGGGLTEERRELMIEWARYSDVFFNIRSFALVSGSACMQTVCWTLYTWIFDRSGANFIVMHRAKLNRSRISMVSVIDVIGFKDYVKKNVDFATNCDSDFYSYSFFTSVLNKILITD